MSPTSFAALALALATQGQADAPLTSQPQPSSPTSPAPPSAADEVRARDLYRAGSEAYDGARYDVAVDAFDAALQIMRPAPLLYSAAQAHRFRYFVTNDLVHLETAVSLFREYLGLEAAGARRDHASEHLAVLTPMLERNRLEREAATAVRAPEPARVIVTSPTAGARVQLDEEASVDVPAAFTLSAGAHRVRVSAPDHETTEERVTAVDGASFALRMPLSPLPGTLAFDVDDGTVVSVDGVAAAGATQVTPGAHMVVARRHGHNAIVERVMVRPGSTQTLTLRPTRTTQSVVGAIGAGVGGVFVLSAAVPVGLALVAEAEAGVIDDVREQRALSTTEAVRYQGLEARRDMANGWTATLVGVGGALVVAGALALIIDVPSEPITAPGATP